MNPHDAFDRILGSLHQSTLDPAHWPQASALIDEACGAVGNVLVVGESTGGQERVRYTGIYRRGQHRHDLEDEYYRVYYPHDERLPRIQRLADGQVAHVPDLYTPEELKTSFVYNEGLRRLDGQDALMVRFAAPDGMHIVWSLGDPVASGGWQSAQLELFGRLRPHIRHFVLVRQALAGADAPSVDLAGLLDNTRIGVLHLDRGGRLLAANAPAADILRLGEGLLDKGGTLQAWLPEDNEGLQKLLGRALPVFGSEPPTGGSITLRRPSGKVLLLHVSPVGGSEGEDFGARRVAVLVLVIDPANDPRVDPARVSEALGLTAAESRVTALLAEGRPLHEIARLTGYQPGYVRLLLERVCEKLGVSGQAALVPRVLAAAALPRR